MINSKILGIVILSTIFGLSSGMVGTLLTRVYLLEESFNVPMFGEIDLSGSSYAGQGLVISNPKKVVVEQNNKVTETVKSVSGNIVGIFEKKVPAKPEETLLDLNSYYSKKDKIAEGLIITSDGWILSNYIPQELKEANFKKEELLTQKKAEVENSYVIITSDNRVYVVDNVMIDDLRSLSFWHVSETAFPVKKFVLRDELLNGQILVGVDWDKNVVLSSILGVKQLNKTAVKSSDDFFEEILLSDELNSEFGDGFFFDLNGNLAAVRNLSGKIIPIYSYQSCINCLLNGDEVVRPSLGVNYVNLSELVPVDNEMKELKGALIKKDAKGVAVIKDSAADLAGLTEGDIIISVNNVEVNKTNDLSHIISTYKSGDEVLIIFDRDGVRSSVSLKLGKI